MIREAWRPWHPQQLPLSAIGLVTAMAPQPRYQQGCVMSTGSQTDVRDLPSLANARPGHLAMLSASLADLAMCWAMLLKLGGWIALLTAGLLFWSLALFFPSSLAIGSLSFPASGLQLASAVVSPIMGSIVNMKSVAMNLLLLGLLACLWAVMVSGTEESAEDVKAAAGEALAEGRQLTAEEGSQKWGYNYASPPPPHHRKLSPPYHYRHSPPYYGWKSPPYYHHDHDHDKDHDQHHRDYDHKHDHDDHDEGHHKHHHDDGDNEHKHDYEHKHDNDDHKHDHDKDHDYDHKHDHDYYDHKHGHDDDHKHDHDHGYKHDKDHDHGYKHDKDHEHHKSPYYSYKSPPPPYYYTSPPPPYVYYDSPPY